MSWQKGAAVAVALLGLGVGVILLGQLPSLQIEVGTRLGLIEGVVELGFSIPALAASMPAANAVM